MSPRLNCRQWAVLQRLGSATASSPATLGGHDRQSARALERRGLARSIDVRAKATSGPGWICTSAGRQLLASRPEVEWIADGDVVVRGVEHLPPDALPGREAEELRAGVEKILEKRLRTKEARKLESQLRGLLDQVNARDSLVYLVARDNRTQVTAEGST